MVTGSAEMTDLQNLLSDHDDERYDIFSQVLPQITLPIVFILSLTVLLLTLQRKAVADIREGVAALRAQDKEELILDLVKQRLLRRIDAVCRRKEKGWKLPEYPAGLSTDRGICRGAGRVTLRDGWPSDAGFKTLCADTKLLNKPESITSITNELYAEALAETSDSDQGRMYDVVIFPGSAPADSAVAPLVLGDSNEDLALRTFALAAIRRQIAQWTSDVRRVQSDVVRRLLDEPIAEQFHGTVGSDVLTHVKKELEQRGYDFIVE